MQSAECGTLELSGYFESQWTTLRGASLLELVLLEEIRVWWRKIISLFRKNYKFTKIRHLAIHLLGKSFWKWLMSHSPAQIQGSASAINSSVDCTSRLKPQCSSCSPCANTEGSEHWQEQQTDWYKLNLLN